MDASDAPVGSRAEIQIAAPPEVAWDVLTRFKRWPEWNPEVKSMSFDGPLAPGSVFRWKAGPGTIVSTLERVEPPRFVRWRGRTFSIKAVHEWRLEPDDGGTLVQTEETFSGLLARLVRGQLQKTLDRSLQGSAAARHNLCVGVWSSWCLLGQRSFTFDEPNLRPPPYRPEWGCSNKLSISFSGSDRHWSKTSSNSPAATSRETTEPRLENDPPPRIVTLSGQTTTLGTQRRGVSDPSARHPPVRPLTRGRLC